MDHDESARQPHRQDGKGKGKGKPAGEDMALDHSEPRFDAPIEARPTTGSTISRIADSATNLASNLLPNPAHSELAAQILPPSKAGSSTTAFRPSLGETSNYRSQPIEGAAGQSFKSAHVQDHVAREEAAFSAFLDGTSVPEHPRSHGTEPIPNAFGARMPQQPFQVSNATDYSQTDGMEVVKLLDSGYEEVTQPESDVPLTTEEAMALRRALFQETPGSRRTGSHDPDWGSILNFFPDYISNGSSGWGYGEISQHLGVSDPSEAKEIWAQQWQDVLSSYTDEVWGDLSSLVRQAREEIEEVRSEGSREATPSELKAIYRLRQILAHIRDG